MVDKQAASAPVGNTAAEVEVSERLRHTLSLKENLADFVLDAEGMIATALETFSAEQLSRWSKPSLAGLNRSALAIDMFLTEGKVAETSVIDLFVRSDEVRSPSDETQLQAWKGSFNGLFVVRSVDQGSYTLVNWLTNKAYTVWPDPSQDAELLARMSPKEIVLGRLMPLTTADKAVADLQSLWTFSGPITLLGKLGKPKLAVAIGNFKKWFPQHLYGDAPELKEAAWDSVKQQYEDFVDLFGGEQVTLSGYELNKKFQVYQEKKTEQQLADAGLDSSKSLGEMAKDAGLSEAEVSEAMDSLGEESATAKALLKSSKALKMVMPKASLPDEFRSAEAVTVFVHPRWGQTLLKDYSRLEEKLSAEPGDEETATALDRMVLKYLEDEQVNAYVWQRMVKAHAQPVEASLQRVVGKPEFEVERDLEGVLAQYGKPLTPELPESASVPVHLHNLFQEAMQAVGKGEKPKGSKKKAKKKSGFGG